MARIFRRAVSLALLSCPAILAATLPKPADWVPIRWQWEQPQSLDLLRETPLNCLLLKAYSPEFVTAAEARGIATLAVIAAGSDPLPAARQAVAAHVTGIVLEGDFPEGTARRVREAAAPATVLELTSRSRMALNSGAAVMGTYQGVWPGIPVGSDGGQKAGPTGSVWIDTNTGFIRAVRAWTDAPLWVANEPPPRTVVTGSRYLRAIADAAMSGARWVVALDSDFSGRLAKRDADAMTDWRRMAALLAYFESHPEWRKMSEAGKLAIVQDPAQGGLLSGGILDMIAVKHTPVRPIPRERLSAEALAGAAMAVNVDAEGMTAEQKEVLRNFTRGGGTLLTGPPGWKAPTATGTNITLEKADLDRVNDIWRDVNSMIGRRNLGVRLFNVSAMLSNLLASADGKTTVLHLVNYSDYPVENVTVQLLGIYRRATLLAPDGAARPLEIYQTEEGAGVDIPKVGVCATLQLEQ